MSPPPRASKYVGEDFAKGWDFAVISAVLVDMFLTGGSTFLKQWYQQFLLPCVLLLWTHQPRSIVPYNYFVQYKKRLVFRKDSIIVNIDRLFVTQGHKFQGSGPKCPTVLHIFEHNKPGFCSYLLNHFIRQLFLRFTALAKGTMSSSS